MIHTKFSKKCNLVLMDEENRLVAVITCKRGTNEITPKVLCAIEEDVMGHSATTTSPNFSLNDFSIGVVESFDVEYLTNDENDEEVRSFYLHTVATY